MPSVGTTIFSVAAAAGVVALPYPNHYTAITLVFHEHCPVVTGSRVAAIQEPVLELPRVT